MHDGIAVAYLRKLAGLTAKEVEYDLEWPKSKIGLCESGYRSFSEKEIKEFRQYIGISRKDYDEFYLTLLLLFEKLNQ